MDRSADVVSDDVRRCVAGRYRLQAELGRGGMGTVWLAEDTLLRRDVAVKEVTLPPTLSPAERATLRERTLREARAAARLDHPAAITVYDVVEEDGRPYIVMELARSRTLAEVVKSDGPLPAARVAEIGLALLGALEAAHRVGIIHRDVKPANVLLRHDGRVTLTDFGIAMSTGDPSITSTGVVLGSPSYISPERARGADPGPASDLWSLAATLYCAVEGRPPFDRGDALSTLTAVVTDDPEPVRLASGRLAGLLNAMLAKDPAQRPDVPTVRAALQAVSAEPGAHAMVDSGPVTVDAGAHTTVLPLVGTPPEPPIWRPPAQPEPPIEAARAQPEPPIEAARAQPEPPIEAAPPAPATPVPPGRPVPARALASDRRRRRLGATAVAALVALVVGVATMAAIRWNRDSTSPRVGTTSTGSPAPAAGAQPPRASGSAQPGRPSASTGAPPSGVPANWQTYRDPAGWSLAHPPGWTVSSRPLAGQGTVTDLTDPATGRFLRVDRTEQPQPNPESDWRLYEPEFAAQNSGYTRVRLEPVTYKNGWPAADWEFTFSRGGTTMHALDREAFTDKGVYALYFQTPADQWAGAQSQLTALLASFQPG